MSSTDATTTEPGGRRLALLAVAALGVVYGDIGTSPLYAIRECFFGPYAVTLDRTNVLGVLSLIVWSLILIISVKYLIFILRADNRGEGGILALMALVTSGADRGHGRRRMLVILLGLFGAALLYGDGMITPAISVLSAVEGLEVATPVFTPYVIPITIAILIGLFLFQQRGTAGVGAIFGPIIGVWFTVLAILGVRGILHDPSVLWALSPTHAVTFFVHNGVHGIVVLAAVFLVVTGGEALYADLGHFGTKPIRIMWFSLVLPSLILNYFGQGALLLHTPEAAHNPFFRLAPEWATYPLIVLATIATVIASQAVISGAFSLSFQAVQLGYAPRIDVEHTSATEMGQIYVPPINWMLMLATIGLVLGFKSSSHLAAAYGIAVTTTMGITTILFYELARHHWHWSRWTVVPLCVAFFVMDLAFFGANALKILHGGWFPLVVAAGVFTVLTTWKRGRGILADRLRSGSLPVADFLASLKQGRAVTRVDGVAVYLTGSSDGTPSALLHNLKHNKVLHEQVVLLTVIIEERPRIPPGERTEVKDLGDGFSRVIARYGFMQEPDIPRLLRGLGQYPFARPVMETTYVLGRETLLATPRPGMAIWREKLFAFLSRNAQRATTYFHLPANRVIEIGVQVEL